MAPIPLRMRAWSHPANIRRDREDYPEVEALFKSYCRASSFSSPSTSTSASATRPAWRRLTTSSTSTRCRLLSMSGRAVNRRRRDREEHLCREASRHGGSQRRQLLGEMLGAVVKQGGAPSRNRVLPGLLEPEMGFEPMTCALRVRCSTTELPGREAGADLSTSPERRHRVRPRS